MSTTWVSGATGLVGKAVVAELRRHGRMVVAHVRPDSRQLNEFKALFEGQGAELDTTPWQLNTLTEALRQRRVSHVICCVGTTRARMRRDGEQGNTYEAVDFGLPKMLAEASAMAGVERLVYLSSAGTGPTAKGAYLRWRWRAEEAVRQSGVPWTIARPAIISGDRQDKRAGEAIAKVVFDGLLTLAPRHLRDRWHSIDDATLARALVRLAFDPAAVHQTVPAEGLRDPT
jgi:NADH dehydrogenase